MGRAFGSVVDVGRLEGHRVLVVGASGGLGRAMAARLDAEGASVAVAARRVELLDELRRQAGGRPGVLRCAVRGPDPCVGMGESAADRFGGLDALRYAPGGARITEMRKGGACPRAT